MTPFPSPIAVSGPGALAAFRQGLTGSRALQLLQEARGRLLIQLAVGVGKTEWLVEIIQHVLSCSTHDLVTVLLPRWDVLHEVRERLPSTAKPKILYPRPTKRCGDLDADWQILEQHGCGQVGRKELCGICPRRRGCFWPAQLSDGLAGARLILTVQQHIVINPYFIDQLSRLTGAKKPLVLIDESDLLLRRCDRIISSTDLERFAMTQEAAISNTSKPHRTIIDWFKLTNLVTQAGDSDLRAGGWRFPSINNGWALEVQRLGREMCGPSFRFIAHDLRHFGRSDAASRERLPDGGLRFAVPPYLGKEFIVFSGSIAKELARYRLDPNHAGHGLVSPFEHYRFDHSDTRWFNIANMAGAAAYFPRNARFILDFYASLIARNIAAGKGTLLVARKKFRQLCHDYLRKRLFELTGGKVKIVTGAWGQHDLTDPRTLPLITYGIVGLNLFEHIECAYCLTGYYVGADALAETIQDIDPTSDRYPIEITSAGTPRRRSVRVLLPDDRKTILPAIVDGAMTQKEADVVVQAVGRVRPFTRPREVITFQTGELPGVQYYREFNGLADARAYFGIPLPSAEKMRSNVEEAARLHVLGLTQKAIAKKMNVSVSTVKRYIKRARGQTL